MSPRHALVAFAAALSILAATPADAARCPEPGAIAVSVSLQIPEPDLRTDVDLGGIRRKSGKAYRPAGAEHMHPVGLTQSRLVSQISFRHALYYDRDGACGRIRQVDASLRLSPLTVFVAREVPQGTCAWQEVYAHEMTHVQIERRTLNDLRPQVETYLRGAAGQLGAVQGSTRQDVQNRLRTYLQSAVDQISEEISRHQSDAHARLDTLAEYRRLSRACGGAIGRILRDAGRTR